MLKHVSFLLLLLIGCCLPPANAQNGDPCDPVVVADLQAQLIADGFDCLEGEGPFACVDDVLDFAFENCPIVGDTTWGDPCDPAFVASVQADLIAQGFDCLEGEGPFACVDDVLNFAFENCPMIGDTTWGDPCDPVVVADLQAQLLAEGFDCLEGAGPFACVDDVFNFAFENCPLDPDTIGCNPCDPAVVANVLQQLIADGFDCLEGAGPFACVNDVLEYAYENCPMIGDTTWGDPCDPVVVADLQAQLIADGFDCLVGAAPFACVEDVFEFAFENCPLLIDTTNGGNPCDSAFVAVVQADLIAQGFDCLEGAGPFACVNDVLDFAFQNCPPDIDTIGCDSAAVAELQAQLIADGYDCLEGAGPFACEHEVVCFAMENCPQDPDTNWVDLPACLQNIPPTVETFQQFLQYLVANCDSSVTQGIPACWLTAPQFDTDEEFFEWLMENCPDDFFEFTVGENNQLASRFFGGNGSVSTQQPGLNAFDFTLSPNPTSSAIELRMPGDTQISRVEMSDYSGKVVYSRSGIDAPQHRISLTALPAGMYVVRVFDQDAAVAAKKVVKQ